jgi:hypothetical protein
MKVEKCAECGSDFYAVRSKMDPLCPENVSLLYGYPNCSHTFKMEDLQNALEMVQYLNLKN